MTTAERKFTSMIKITKKRLIIIIIIALVLLVGAAAFAVWQAQGGRFIVPDSSSKQAKKVPQYTKDKRQDLINEVNEKYGSGDFSGAIQLIEGQQNAGDVETQVLLASAYATSGDYKKALDTYKKLYDAGKLPEIEFDNMAVTADQAGEYQTAIDVYRRAKEYAVSSGSKNDDEIATYDYLISELEKKV